VGALHGLLLLPLAVSAGQVSPTALSTFVNGTVTDADAVNANFAALRTEINDNHDRITQIETGVEIAGNAAACPGEVAPGTLRYGNNLFEGCTALGWVEMGAPTFYETELEMPSFIQTNSSTNWNVSGRSEVSIRPQDDLVAITGFANTSGTGILPIGSLQLVRVEVFDADDNRLVLETNYPRIGTEVGWGTYQHTLSLSMTPGRYRVTGGGTILEFQLEATGRVTGEVVSTDGSIPDKTETEIPPP
jgi:hypothetical protein